MADLNALIGPADASVQLNAAVGLNERGEIAVQGTLANGDQHAFLLIPCDEIHPGIDGCDYSMVEASAPTSTAPASREPAERVPAVALWRRNHRFHFSAFDPKN
jgi:hypothetical protein